MCVGGKCTKEATISPKSSRGSDKKDNNEESTAHVYELQVMIQEPDAMEDDIGTLPFSGIWFTCLIDM